MTLRFRLTAVFLFVAIAPALAAGTPADDWEKTFNAGLDAETRGDLASAVRSFESALSDAEQLRQDGVIVTTLNKLATVLRARGDYGKAEQRYKQVLERVDKFFGGNKMMAATALNGLGAAYLAQGKYAEAEPLLKRAIDLERTAFETSDPRRARSLYTLAQVYGAQGQFGRAEPLYQDAVKLDRKSVV